MTFREMLIEDLDQVMEIETDLFAMPWTKEGMFTFLTREDTMFFVVEEKGRILGYCSMQTVLDEGDILNVAVRSDRQKEGIGYFLVDSMLMLAQAQGISLVHLEVRESNGTARRLYCRGWTSQKLLYRSAGKCGSYDKETMRIRKRGKIC
mgnify:CR=1 FL=1